MFYYYLDFIDDDFFLFLSFVGAIGLALILGIAFHEFCHAWSASLLGDQTAASQGRLTLNPLAHLDPFGTFLLLLAGFGWGKPTPVNPYRLRNGRTGMAVVAAAGPLSNLAVAAVLAIPIRLGWVTAHYPFASLDVSAWTAGDYVGLFLYAGVFLNATLAVFNFLPLAPLDGFRVWTGLLPIELARPLARMERYGILVLFGLFFIGPAVGIEIFEWIVLPAVNSIADSMTGL